MFDRIVIKALTPTETHCATGEQCISAKYCPANNVYVDGRCQEQTGVSSGAQASRSNFSLGRIRNTGNLNSHAVSAVQNQPAVHVEVPESRYLQIWNRCIKDPNNIPIAPHMASAGLSEKVRHWCCGMFSLLQNEGYLPGMDPVANTLIAMDKQGKLYKVGDTAIIAKQFLKFTPL